MNSIQVFAKRVVGGFALLAALGLSPVAPAEDAGRAEVRAVQGTATYSAEGLPARSVKVGAVLTSGTVIKTDPGSSVDLFLGNSAGLVRLAENSTLSLDKLVLIDTGAETAVEVQLHVPEGEMYFNVNKLSKASRYEIKLPTGVAGIRGTKGSVSFRPGADQKPPVILLEGKLVFVHVPVGGALTTHVMSAPPAVYFSPTEGVKNAPLALQREVERELDDAERKQPPKKDRAMNDKNNNNNSPRFTYDPEPVLSPGTGVPVRR